MKAMKAKNGGATVGKQAGAKAKSPGMKQAGAKATSAGKKRVVAETNSAPVSKKDGAKAPGKGAAVVGTPPATKKQRAKAKPADAPPERAQVHV